MTASDAPLAIAASTILAFSAYDVVFRPDSAPRSLRGHGTVMIELTDGGPIARLGDDHRGESVTASRRPQRTRAGRHGDADAAERDVLPFHRCGDAFADRGEVRLADAETLRGAHQTVEMAGQREGLNRRSILMVSNTPSPTMIPWSSTLIAGCSGDSSNCPFNQVFMHSPYPHLAPGLGSLARIG